MPKGISGGFQRDQTPLKQEIEKPSHEEELQDFEGELAVQKAEFNSLHYLFKRPFWPARIRFLTLRIYAISLESVSEEIFMKVLVTGAAGFIGSALSHRLLKRGDTVVGLDNLNHYYDIRLKNARLERLESHPQFEFVQGDIADLATVTSVFEKHRPTRVVNQAAQAGVRYSITNPHAYMESNLKGFLNILEGSRHAKVEHLVYASSSSVYGSNRKLPFSETVGVDHPLSLYAATKRSNELMAHSYSHLFGLPTTGLRYFTVYGPWGRPDMALFLFTKSILSGKPIQIFNHGNHRRDFTYIDDIVEGVVQALDHVAQPDPKWSANDPRPNTSQAPFRVYNIGNNTPVDLLKMVEVLEDTLGRKAIREYLDLQPGDVTETFADVSNIEADFLFRPSTPIEVGIRRFVDWYQEFYGNEHQSGVSRSLSEAASPLPI